MPLLPTLDYLISDSQVIRDSLSHFGKKLIDSQVINDSEVKLENKLKHHRGDFGLHINLFPLYLVANR